ncbi:hypothetical protein Pelo_209 [Pelomyxa schiedti]|nr:hypothetical protein Pelo_202 [Pelomyxa schiedti]KAH3767916.1 hypothetical protein Pelo_209 [Pelomyxa schiedti]
MCTSTTSNDTASSFLRSFGFGDDDYDGACCRLRENDTAVHNNHNNKAERVLWVSSFLWKFVFPVLVPGLRNGFRPEYYTQSEWNRVCGDGAESRWGEESSRPMCDCMDRMCSEAVRDSRLASHLRHYEGAEEALLLGSTGAMFPLLALVSKALVGKWGGWDRAMNAAATHGNTEVARWLLEHAPAREVVETRDCLEWRNVGSEVVFECGAVRNVVDKVAYSWLKPSAAGPLVYSLGHGNMKFARWVMDTVFGTRGAWTETEEAEIITALYACCSVGQLKGVKWILESLPPDTWVLHGHKALRNASSSGNVALLEFIWDFYETTDWELTIPLRKAASSGCAEAFMFFRDKYNAAMASKAWEALNYSTIDEHLKITVFYSVKWWEENLLTACETGNTKYVQVLCGGMPDQVPDVINAILLKSINLETYKVLLERCAPSHVSRETIKKVAVRLCIQDSVESLAWLHATFTLREEEVHEESLLAVSTVQSYLESQVANPCRFRAAGFLSQNFKWSESDLFQVISDCWSHTLVGPFRWLLDTFSSTFQRAQYLFMLDTFITKPSWSNFPDRENFLAEVIPYVLNRGYSTEHDILSMISAVDPSPERLQCLSNFFDLHKLVAFLPMQKVVSQALSFDMAKQTTDPKKSLLVLWTLQYFHVTPALVLPDLWYSLCSTYRLPMMVALGNLSPCCCEFQSDDMKKLFTKFLDTNHLSCAIWFANKFRLNKGYLSDPSSLFLSLFTHGPSHFPELKWYTEYFLLTPAEALGSPPTPSHLADLMYVLTDQLSTRNTQDNSKHTGRMIQWLISFFGITPESMSLLPLGSFPGDTPERTLF